MSIQSYQNKINQLSRQIADFLKKENDEKKKQISLNSKINDLSGKALKAKTLTSIQNHQRQSNTKQKELLRVERKLADISKQLANKRTELSKAEVQLQKELSKESKKQEELTKKRNNEERKIIREREQANRNQISQLRNINSEIENQQNLFSDNIFQYQEDISSDKGEFELDELVDLNKRIDNVLEQLNKLGLGQHILFDEIEELKGKGKKMTKKDLKLMLIGKIVSFGMKTIDTNTAQSIFESITGIDMTKFIE